tara:strand:- start:245 stop:421 length:177 start_codon:yes stop_codon:yes gene_type:complete
MQIILSALFIYLVIQCVRFISKISIKRSNTQSHQNIKNSYKNLDIQDADYEDINKNDE